MQEQNPCYLFVRTSCEVESEILSKSHSFFTEKSNEDFGNPRRRQCSVCFILKWRNDKIFQSVTAAFIRELIQLSIQFTKVLWSSNKTTKEKTEIFFWGGGGGAHGNDETLFKIKHFERGISKMLKKSNFIFVFEPCLFLRKFL